MSRSSEPKPGAQAPEPYDQVIGRLEKLVADLEGGGLSLEQSLEKFAEGMGLARQAQKTLDEAERRIEKLVRTADGAEATAPLDAAEEG